jgi:CheY-like chemotaxis protein
VESFKPDVLLLDLKMPGMSGQAVLKEIKSNVNTRHIRVIILSGHVDGPEKRYLKEAGAEGILDKPIDRQELLSLIGTGANKMEVSS